MVTPYTPRSAGCARAEALGRLIRARMRPTRPALAPSMVAAALFGLGCGADAGLAPGPDGGGAGPRGLLDHAAWGPAPAEADAFPEHRPDPVVCDEASLFENLGVLEVETDLCNYVSLVQPIARRLDPGDRIRFAFWHLQLFAAEPAEAHLALLIGGELITEYRVPIPSGAYIETRELIVPRALAAGASAQLHLHNHGQNHWRIGPVELVR